MSSTYAPPCTTPRHGATRHRHGFGATRCTVKRRHAAVVADDMSRHLSVPVLRASAGPAEKSVPTAAAAGGLQALLQALSQSMLSVGMAVLSTCNVEHRVELRSMQHGHRPCGKRDAQLLCAG